MFEDFAGRKTYLHRADPRVKIIVFVLFAFMSAFSPDIGRCLSALGFGIALTVYSGINLKEVSKRILAVNTFIAFFWISVFINLDGAVKFHFSPSAIPSAALITVKANAVFLLAVSLLSTTDIIALAHSLWHIKMPKKLVYIFYFSYRYIGIMQEEMARLFRSAKMRGFRAGISITALKTYAYIAGIVFARSYDRAQRIYNALLMRGAGGNFPMAKHFDTKAEDIVFAFISLLLFGAIIWKF